MIHPKLGLLAVLKSLYTDVQLNRLGCGWTINLSDFGIPRNNLQEVDGVSQMRQRIDFNLWVNLDLHQPAVPVGQICTFLGVSSLIKQRLQRQIVVNE